MTYIIDDGQAGSYDHEATASTLYPDPGSPVTLTCACGGWSETGLASGDAEPSEELIKAWADHVYAVTGQARPVPVEQPLSPGLATDTDTGQARPRPVLYEPEHDAATTEQIRQALALRGYTLTRTEAAMPDMLTAAWATVTVEGDGSLTLHDGEVGTGLPPSSAFASPAEYAFAMARWLDEETEGVEIPSAPERSLSPVELTQLIVSGSRTLTSRVHLIEDAAQAGQIASILDEVIEAAQQLRGRALAIADSDAEVEAAALFDAVMSHLDDEGGAR